MDAVPRSEVAARVRRAAVSMIVGMAIVFLMFVSRPEIWSWRLFVYGATIGLAIFASCRGLDVAFGGRLFRPRGSAANLVRAAGYLAGGEIGFLAATIVLSGLGLMPFRFDVSDLRLALLINGAAAMVIGVLFSSYAALQRRLRESIERIKEQEFAEKELALARELQVRLLPPESQSGAGWSVAARNVPAGFVAGDFFDVFRLSNGDLGVVVADVSGKGIGASLIMASVKAVLGMMAEGRSASQTLAELNRKLVGDLSAREFVALAYARFDPALGTIEIANAGLPDPYRLRKDGSVEALSAPGARLPLGARAGLTYQSLTTALVPGERVLFLTDGLPEALTPAGEPFGYETLEGLLSQYGGTPGAFLDGLFSSVRAATSPILGDDWTALVLEAKEIEPREIARPDAGVPTPGGTVAAFRPVRPAR